MQHMKILLAISLLTISLAALADPVASQSALNYSADQSTPPIATKSANTQLQTTEGTRPNHTFIQRLKHTAKQHPKRHNNKHLMNKK